MVDTMRIDGGDVRDIPADDRGLAYGDGVFRTLRIVAGRAIAWPFHRARLVHDCAALGLGAPAREALEADIAALVGDTETGVLKIMVTRGSGGRGYTPPGDPLPRRIVSLHRGAPVVPETLALPISPIVLATPSALAGVKHLNRLEQVLARQHCDQHDMADAVMCDSSRRVICTTMRNLIFADAAGRWWTPDLSRAGVIGATRERLRAARDVAACEIDVARLHGFRAAIACNSVGGAVAVNRIGDHRFTDSDSLGKRANALLLNSA